MIAQPSKKLVDQTLVDLRTLGAAVPSRAVHEGTCDGPIRALVRPTEEAGEGGEVLLATQAALARMPYFCGADRWDLVLDESPDAIWERNLEVQETADTFRALFADFAGKVASEHWEVHVLQSQWARMVGGEGERLLAFAALKRVASASSSGSATGKVCASNSQALSCSLNRSSPPGSREIALARRLSVCRIRSVASAVMRTRSAVRARGAFEEIGAMEKNL